MRYRIRLTTRNSLERYAHRRERTPGFIVREALKWYNGDNLSDFYAKCSRVNSTMIDYETGKHDPIRMDSLLNWHMDANPAKEKRSPITVDPEDLKQMIQIPRYTTPPFSG